MTENTSTRCGYVAIAGRPNVGKSTLLNHILGQKLAITSRKPQTTRHNMLGIKTEGDVQAIYVDTPGMHKANDKALNRYMNRNASAALKDVDVVIFVVDRTRWTDEDQLVLERVQYVSGPVITAVNKTDRMDESRADPALAVAAAAVAQCRDRADFRPARPQPRSLGSVDRQASARERAFLPGRSDHRPQ